MAKNKKMEEKDTKKLNDKDLLNGTIILRDIEDCHNHLAPCPRCGYCPYCGRGGYYPAPYYLRYTYPYYPCQTTSPYTDGFGADCYG